MTFIELPPFTRAITELVDDAQYAKFQAELLTFPKVGKVIPGSGGLRKVRMKLPGRGKSGGARVIYFHAEARNIIVLFFVYTKAEMENLDPVRLARLRGAVERIKKELL